MKDVVPQGVRNTRVEMLRILSEKKKQAFYRKHLGTARPVLFEKEEDGGKMHGFTDNYIKVTSGYDPLLINTVQPVRYKSIMDSGDVKGEILIAVH
jgi:threonylcarbamoyladenosine tRNA methylthiotransferase MtaB